MSARPAAPLLDRAPRLSVDEAGELALRLFGVAGRVEQLTSERDQNFLIDATHGERLVLKIANALESAAMVDAQQQAMTRVAESLRLAPHPIPGLDGALLREVTLGDGTAHLVWAVSWIPGEPLASVGHRSRALSEELGRRIAEIRTVLSPFDHPAIHREFHWDLAHGRMTVAELRGRIGDGALGTTIDRLLARFDESTAPHLASLEQAAIHGDLNDHNVLVRRDRDPFVDGQRVAGVVDFGDMVRSWAVGDLAIAAAYATLDAADPLSTVACMIRGHTQRLRLDERELSALFGLIVLRLCTSACIAARQRAERPDNAYLDVSQQPIARTLPALARIPFGLAEAVFRQAAGLEPSAASAHIRAFLSAQAGNAAPLLGPDLAAARQVVLDMSVTGNLVSADERENAEPLISARIGAALDRAGAALGIGRWDEPRLIYGADFFGGAAPEAERRTVHLGCDLFAPAGTPVHAPLDGLVHAFADNDAPQDYGPVIILRHQTDSGTPFYTLYGHLSRQSLPRLHVGQRVKRGDMIATLGTPAENVGWTPHLHIQVIIDLLGLGTGFPGVGRASQREVWRSLCPDPDLFLRLVPAEQRVTEPSVEETLAARRRFVANSLSIAYRDPLRIVRGWRQFLFDDAGRRLLDAYNNVPHVGHAHPRVVRAGAEQMALLNTNTRYLSDLLVEYAERLSATLPAPLSVCFFVTSASEGNELALRLARARTGRRDLIVLEAAYHGHTTTLIDVSPYKHNGPGGQGAPAWVHVAPLPDDYRGQFRRADPQCGRRYAEQVADLVRTLGSAGHPVGAFLAETCPSVGGQIMLPTGYLPEVYRAIRGAGGVCIADEVQTGLGRIGTHFWAFEAHGVVPDIVVVGKPLGNGHPMAAVITTPEIASAFDNGMEFFSTFGGNTVSCAIGLAVLDVLRDEGLQAHALRVGSQVLAELQPLVDRYELVGDVRGSGLFLGVELVRDRVTLEPAGEEASFVANRMRELGILLGTDGPYHNVVKIRPPMPFDASDGARLVETLERVLRSIPSPRVTGSSVPG